MKMKYMILTATAVAASAQTPPNAGIAYQQAGVIVTQAVGGPMKIETRGAGLMPPPGITGSPFSAVEETHSLQVLGDGTRIERSESQHIYRDSMGRTRVESSRAGTGIITIEDPVEGSRFVVNPADQTAQKMPSSRIFELGQRGGAVLNFDFPFSTDAAPAGSVLKSVTVANAMVFAEEAPSSREKVEILAPQNINGVMASGRQVSRTIAAGAIGNDRPIQLVGESWYSNDLQMVVKSSSSDPRFGDSGFELINIVRSEPDPALFQIPPGYTVTDVKALKTKVRTKE